MKGALFFCICATLVPRFIDAAATRAGSSAQKFRIRNNNIRKAVRLWMADRTTARRVYGPIESWDTGLVTAMDSLFLGSENFGEDISAWDTSNVKSMQWLFYNSANFTANISGWDVSQVSDMTMAFAYAKNFQGDVTTWDTRSVKSLWYTFAYSSGVKANISTWNTVNVASMQGTFQHSSGLEPGGSLHWDTTNVEDMTHVFSNASWFNHVLCWNLTSVSADSLQQAYCDNKKRGGFDCNCIPPDLRGSINSECFFPSPSCARDVAISR
ncbi:(Lipo)protein [Seminavis robusta]|uniref:(Lipo)protein n=1 Tax=Seminavis robusta TaxID=568900 RepID=A0A9N8HFJ9_9STRA|nr:(Lipo)protein [Seminavis robusta]|eukprot:Sro459_g147400.1 (Lipo)protein (269) ;mRNA; f:63995-64801